MDLFRVVREESKRSEPSPAGEASLDQAHAAALERLREHGSASSLWLVAVRLEEADTVGCELRFGGGANPLEAAVFLLAISEYAEKAALEMLGPR